MKQNQSKIKAITGLIANTIVSLNLVMPSYAFADKNSNGSFAGVLDVSTTLLKNAGAVMAQAQANRQAQEQFSRLNLALTPIEVSNSYFPGCRTLPAMTPEVFQACKQMPGSAIQRNIIQAILQKSSENRRTYTEYSTIGNSRIANSNPAGSQNVNNGLQCVEDRIDSTKQLLEQRITGITNMLNEMNKAKEQLDASLQPQIDGLKELDAYLDGGSALNSNHTRKYSNLFRQLGSDANCSSVLDTVTVQNMAKKGLNNINKKVNKIRTGGNGGVDKVTNLLRNQGNIQSSIRKYATDLQTTITKRGIDRVSENLLKGDLKALGINASMDLNSSPALAGAITNQMRQFQDNRTDLQDRFSKLGINSSTSLARSVFGQKENNFNLKLKRWRDQQQDQCLREKISVSKSENYDYFLSLIDHVDTRIRSKSNLGTLRIELKKHLNNSSLSIEEKIRKVQQILGRKNYRKVKIFSEDTNDASEAKGDKSPVAILNRYANDCKDEYRRLETNSEGQTLMEMEKEAKRIHNEFKDQERRIPSVIANSIYDRVINCRQDGEAIPYSLSPNSCNSKKLDLSSPSFCLGQSVECAKTINTCSQKIEDTIVRVTTQAAVVAKNINTQVEKFVTFQKGLLRNLKQQSQAQAVQLEKIFRNSTFKLPDDLSIEQMTTDFKLSDNHATYDHKNIMKSFEEKMSALRKSMQKQNELVAKEIEDEKKIIVDNYKKQSEHWEELSDRCEKLINDYNKAEGERVAAENKARGEQQKLASNFCYDYNKFQVGPGCDKALDGLDEAARDVSSAITGDAVSFLNSIRGYCAGNQKENNENGGNSTETKSQKTCPTLEAKFAKAVTDKKPQEQERILVAMRQIGCAKEESQFNQVDSDIDVNQLNQQKPVLVHCAAINDHGVDFNSLSSSIDRAGAATLDFMTRQ